MTDSISLTLSTKIAPAKKILVDGTEYDLLGPDHLSPDDEAEALALFARHNILQQDLAMTPNVQKGQEIAKRLRKARLLVIGKLTTIPAEVANKLPITAQAVLLETIQAEMATEDVDEDDPAEVEAPAGTDV